MSSQEKIAECGCLGKHQPSCPQRPCPGCGEIPSYRRAPSEREKAREAVIKAAKKARAGGPYTPMFDALDKLKELE